MAVPHLDHSASIPTYNLQLSTVFFHTLHHLNPANGIPTIYCLPQYFHCKMNVFQIIKQILLFTYITIFPLRLSCVNKQNQSMCKF